jgi:hypothetical protein
VANTLVNPDWVTKETLRRFSNELTFLANVDKQLSDEFRQSGSKVGDTVRARLPFRPTVGVGQALTLNDIYDGTVSVSLTRQLHSGLSYSSAEATTDLDKISERYVQPMAISLANQADMYAFSDVYADFYSSVGVPGTTPSAAETLLDAGVKLTDLGASGERNAILDPLAMSRFANASATLFNPVAVIAENYRKGLMAKNQLGISGFYQDPNRPLHTTGTFTASTPLVNAASQTGSTLATDGWASGASSLKKGDIFTIAGVYSVNRVSFVSTGRLQQFVVTADTSDSAGAMATLPISPPIITSGQLQTVSGSPADNAVITVLGATSATSGTLATTVSPQGLILQPDAVAWVSADLVMPAGGESSRVRAPGAGISIRWWKQSQIMSDQHPMRLDILCGAATLQAERGVRVWG